MNEMRNLGRRRLMLAARLLGRIAKDELRHLSRRRRLLAAIVVLLVIFMYSKVYKATVRPVPYGATGPAMIFMGGPQDIKVLAVLPEYRHWPDGAAQHAARVFFAPANWVDRMLRPRMWDPDHVGPIICFAFIDRPVAVESGTTQ